MFFKTFTVLCLCAALAACYRTAEPGTKAAAAPAVSAPDEKKTVTALPEHFDRVRDEQLEKEEDQLRRRDHQK